MANTPTNEPIPEGAEVLEDCPLSEADDKYTEAHYFLERMMAEYHNPQKFRWNLNAFLQALRNVTFLLQSQLAHRDGFDSWYAARQEEMGRDALLRRFVEGRNIVVKQRNLLMKSTARIGVFMGGRLKLGLVMDVPAHLPSSYIISEMAPRLGFVPEDHAFIDEQYGVQRDWIAEELGEDNVLTLCDTAWVKISSVLRAAHRWIGLDMATPDLHGHDPAKCDTLTETDLDPSLPKKWGWTEE
jgi:hypothetical protein